MNDIQMLFERLNGIEATIAQASRSNGPLSDGARLTMESLEQRRDELKEMVEALAADQLVDVCDYRIVPNQLNRYPIKEVGQSLSRWQDTVTAFFAAVREGKARLRAQYSDSIEQLASMNFGYAYEGSLGVVMYVPNDQLLLSDTDLDRAIEAIMALVDTETVADVRKVAEKFGKAAVKSFFDWSKVHTDADLSAGIKWQRGKDVRFEKFVQPAELERVQSIIKIADNREDTTDAYPGILVALNVTGLGSFKMSFPDLETPDVTGKFDEHFNRQQPHKVPGRYRATLRKITLTSLWSNEEKTEWELLELDETQTD